MDRTVPAGAALLLDFIGQTEAPRGYDTVYGNNKMPQRLTTMTFDQVVADGPRRSREYGSSAAGRYQFMRNTLDDPKSVGDLKGQMGLRGDEQFSADLQDRMAFHLLKRRGYESFMAGKIDAVEFGKRLAQEWASFPVLASVKGSEGFMLKRGQSYYAGDGLNKALVKPEAVEAVLAQVKGAPLQTSPTVVYGDPPPTVNDPPATCEAPRSLWAQIIAAILSILSKLKGK